MAVFPENASTVHLPIAPRKREGGYYSYSHFARFARSWPTRRTAARGPTPT
jgi:hypothetical protein